MADDDTAGGADGALMAADAGDGTRELELVLLVTCAGVLWCWCWC